MINNKFALIFLISLCCIHSSLLGQDSVITGRLVDSKTSEPIPFATLKLKNRMIGVISNADGDFQLPARTRLLTEAIEISCIGYTTLSISLNQLADHQLNIVKLEPATNELPEAVVIGKKIKSLSASRIVELAIERIPDNFPVTPFSYVGYYRDYQFKDNESEYVNLNEAIVEIVDQGFKSQDQLATQIKLYEYKRNTDFESDSSIEIPYDNKPAYFGRGKNKFIPNAVLSPFGGNELSILRVHDAIRNYEIYSYSFVNKLKEDFVNNHFFKREEAVFLDKVQLYCISFESKPSVSGTVNFAKGKIFIEKNNYAIHKIEYSCYNKTMRETQLMYDIQLEYARRDSLMYLNYISFNNFFKTRNERDFRVIDIVFDRELNGFILNFNSEPEKTTALNKSNYEFKIGEVPLEIKRIETGEDKTGKQLYIILEQKEGMKFNDNNAELSSKLKFDIKNIRDIDNRELDKVTFTTIHQFRELFIQKINTHPTEDFHSGFQKDIPLSQNLPEPVTQKEDTGYWMNSPLKKKQ